MQKKPGSVLTLVLGTILLLLIGLLLSGSLERWVSGNTAVYLIALVVAFSTVIVAKLVSIILQKYLTKAQRHLKVGDQTRFALFSQLTTLTVYLVGFGLAGSFIPSLRNLSVSLFAGAGILAVVVGFATQKTLGNLVSGIMIAAYQPYRIGDKLEFADEYGTVEDITLRHTVIRTWDNRRIVVPNSKMDDEIIKNYTIKDKKMLGWLDLGISYDSDIDLARQIMIEEVKAHRHFVDNRSAAEVLAEKPPVSVKVVAWDDSAIRLRLYFWTADQSDNWQMKTELLESIKKRFDKEGVEIPYPYHTIVQKKDLPKPKRLKARQSGRGSRAKTKPAATTRQRESRSPKKR